MDNTTSVFVYGTLKPYEDNYQVACRAGQHKMLGAASLTGFELYDLGFFPFIARGNGTVYGELLDYGQGIDTALEHLDRLEGYVGPGDPRNMYDRVKLEAIVLGQPVTCWAYVFARPVGKAEHLANGLWPRQVLKSF